MRSSKNAPQVGQPAESFFPSRLAAPDAKQDKGNCRPSARIWRLLSYWFEGWAAWSVSPDRRPLIFLVHMCPFSIFPFVVRVKAANQAWIRIARLTWRYRRSVLPRVLSCLLSH